jgi:two-component system, cell cycle sensor histidine kinase and response regulator CckA
MSEPVDRERPRVNVAPSSEPVADGEPLPPAQAAFARLEAEHAQLKAEHAQLKAQFLQAQKMEAVGRLASGVAHDFKNVLTLIAGYADLLLKQSEAAAIRDPLGEIRSACQRAIVLAEQLLSYSRREAAAQAPLSLNTILADAGRMLQRMLPANVDFSIRQAPGLGLVVANAGQMHQVLMNLVVNARDAMPSGGRLTVDAQNRDVAPDDPDVAAGARPGPHVVLTVADTGVGMDAATRLRAVEPFFTTKEGKVGTGLGLSTVHAIVTDCRGRVVIESAPGVGTTIRVYLPRVEAADAAGVVPPGSRSDAVPRARRILVVDEDASVRRLLVDLLSGAGYDVNAVGGIPGDIDALAPHDLAVVDLVTLDRSGVATPPFGHGKPSRVLGMSSAAADGGPSTRGPKVGVTLAKPIAPRQLLRAVRDMLEAD